MIRAARLILLGVALASWLGVGVAVAGALVKFAKTCRNRHQS